MPAARRGRHSSNRVPLPRITDPYAPPKAHLTITTQQIIDEEEARVAHNKKICRLWKQHQKAQRSTRSIQRDWPTLLAYDMEVLEYERQYGKFIPDRENAAWFIRKTLCIAELMHAREIALGTLPLRHDHPDMVVYLRAAATFEIDFGHAFSASDGLDYELQRMESHAASANNLAILYKDDIVRITAAISPPLKFKVDNPYSDGDQRQLDFESERIFFRFVFFMHDGSRFLDWRVQMPWTHCPPL
ncbi:hypothetical protein FB451DRAFT_1306307 [Mycena latifolia]|nr:hypothetical protein FB451DRAFT_1306307 [Mycena latifolia]